MHLDFDYFILHHPLASSVYFNIQIVADVRSRVLPFILYLAILSKAFKYKLISIFIKQSSIIMVFERNSSCSIEADMFGKIDNKPRFVDIILISLEDQVVQESHLCRLTIVIIAVASTITEYASKASNCLLHVY